MISAGEFFAQMMTTPLGGLLARPWLDRVALKALTKWHFPASRAWAAADSAAADVDLFLANIPLSSPPPELYRDLRLRVAQAATAGAIASEWLVRWEELFFRTGPITNTDLAEVESRCRNATHRHMTSRKLFSASRFLRHVPKLKLETPSPQAAAVHYAKFCAAPDLFYQLPDPLPRVERSHGFIKNGIRHYWLKFTTPDDFMNDSVWAHVFEPADLAMGQDIPTLIHGHGVGVETEFMDGVVDGHTSVPQHGVRLIRFEAPFHCRRRKKGYYGSEPFFAGLPISGLQSLSAEAKEFGVLTAWAHEEAGSSRVAIGGTSMGALASQLAASQAHHWPTAARPDALLLLTTCDDVASLGLTSSLTKALGIEAAMQQAGWTEDLLAPYRNLANAADQAPLPPENIVMLLGTEDSVTPFPQGWRQAQRWQLPSENIFLRRQGHFSAAVGLLHDAAPVHRCLEILRR